ncbi:hypothetical protein VCHA50P417_160077 [Vibrio chagasii]|nr:hypothetical protein VCHA27O13_160095 [Vibrio chagasii]CAH6811860.1 hypothetical protein VCHA35O142_130079 [Vibrio chagasii]CAH6844513.1 hypothetical protein VCHA36P166_10076 [Vibrio chagasii]CAH6982202.1 hypothetical protein VCHA50P417_160077 [Vibrio chagasii]CAH7025396.1 hypothetical protein VCHA48P442_160079 [Vibrio chagasii]
MRKSLTFEPSIQTLKVIEFCELTLLLRVILEYTVRISPPTLPENIAPLSPDAALTEPEYKNSENKTNNKCETDLISTSNVKRCISSLAYRVKSKH